MKKELMEILCCPMCKSDLELKVEKEEGNDIIEGLLICKKCGEYKIEEGIPNLLPKE
ncbi:MAG: methytransferase partner Trm112 [Candidatus Thermoplasmatota archaeon]